MRPTPLALLTLAIASLQGCGAPPEPVIEEDPPSPQVVIETPIQRVTDRPGNTDGVVPIFMYHRITDNGGKYDRTPEGFRSDLQGLHDLGFRPVTLGQYVDNTMELPPGASPVVLTFDDSHPTQIRFTKEGKINPDSAIGIWMSFAEAHQDFPVRGTFFVLKSGFLGRHGDGYKWLLKNGCEVESHTVSHDRLDKMNSSEVKKELAESHEFLIGLGARPRFLSYPFGIRPANRDLTKQFELNGKTYKHDAAVMVGAGPAPSPNDPDRDLYRLPRIQAGDAKLCSTEWLNKVEAGEVQPYVQP